MHGIRFSEAPTVDLLQRLVNGSLKQSLAKAVRLWVILRSLYGDLTDEVQVDLGESFTYQDWSTRFFQPPAQVQNSHGEDKAPPLHDPACARSLTDWLFDSEFGIKPADWIEQFRGRYGVTETEVQTLLRTGSLNAGRPELELFGCTRKLLKLDFVALAKQGFLLQQINQTGKSRRSQYRRVEALPDFREPAHWQGLLTDSAIGNFIQTDLADIVAPLAQPIRGIQRFFLQTDYIVPGALSRQVQQFQTMLMDCWQRELVPPLQLVYKSARLYDDIVELVVYPVCIYYFQRAPYLFAYGQVPGQPGLDWYDYRLDHIQQLQVADWDGVPTELKDYCYGPQAPSPETVQAKMLDAWGFDFYRPVASLLLRFDRYFYGRYIEGTERATLFGALSYKQVLDWVQRDALDDGVRQLVTQVLRLRSQEDIYCRVRHRVGDNNIVMRLRAWGPNVEVLLPWELRRRMAGDVRKLWGIYGEV
ncbi:MAG: TIGR03985 family CRISPR-associated protein [Symploca sp. SIO2G7]|nr:TIGR03985 family CRISPR-associated protein [Symploca sp. SIO2G7]